ncbi:hypothetical protein D3C87_128970 [compost metagenome]
MYMKKIFGLIAALILVLGCDDGDMTFKTFDFSSANVEKCDNAIFKINSNGTEVLILNLDPSALINVSTLNPVTGKHEPRIINLGGTGSNTILYRNYESSVKAGQLCGGITTTPPNILDEWKGEGTLSIRTDIIKTEGKLKYTHQITLKNISFNKGDETIIINDNLFGSVDSPLDVTFNFVETGAEEPVITPCTDYDLLFTKRLNEALILSLADDLPTAEGIKTIPLENQITNSIIFKTFESTITDANICNLITPPPTPKLKQQWRAKSGTISIITTKVAGNFTHEIRFMDITFSNITTPAETFNLSDIITVDPQKGYLFGKY